MLRIRPQRRGPWGSREGDPSPEEPRPTQAQATARLESELATCRNCLRRVASDFAASEDTEHRRLARGLHDRIGQPLALAVLQLGVLEDDLPAPMAARIEGVRASLKELIGTTRSLSFEISNPLLDTVGLEAALEDLAQRIEADHGVRVEIRTEERASSGLPETTRAVAYQVVRELLVNVVKHAAAARVRLSLLRAGGEGDGELVVSVEDQGAGFDPNAVFAAPQAEGGSGLLGARERLYRLGGRLDVESAPGGGTRITMHLPVGE